MGEPLIVCREATLAYRRFPVLGPVSLELQRGDFLGVVGPNGAGKSSLLRLMSGQARPLSGYVRVNCDGMAYLLQHHDYMRQIPFTVEDVVAFGRVRGNTLAFRPGRGDSEAIATALADMGLTEMRRRLYRELSGGEQRKVHFARLAAQGAEVALLDEPTAGLDLDWQERVTRLASRFHSEKGKTVVMVTHDADRLPAACNKVLLLKDGLVLDEGRPEQVFQPQKLSELYDCAIEVVERDGRYHAFSSYQESGL